MNIRWRCLASPTRVTVILVTILDVVDKNESWFHFESLVLPGICRVYKEVLSVLIDLLLIVQLLLNALTY